MQPTARQASTAAGTEASARRYVWRPSEGMSRQHGPRERCRIIVADSWLVAGGRVRGLSAHHRRFTRSCRETGVDELTLAAFWADVVALLPSRGRWFPRVELIADPDRTLRLLIRPAPPARAEARVWVCDSPDPRRLPRRKGPDLDRLALLRDRAASRGADDALLTTPRGFVLETAASGVIWWEDDVICLPAPSLRILPSVTCELILAAAEASAVKVRRPRRLLAGLDRREVWLVNALHGIRPVVEWRSGGLAAGPPRRAPQWHALLDQFAQPVA
jgi:branched-subunit amino acid aminotransferase/4-amino-4-deoxychorismate lyase